MEFRRRLIVDIACAVAVLCASAGDLRAQTDTDAAVALERALVTAIARAEHSVVSIARIRMEQPEPVVVRDPFQLQKLRADADDPASPDFVPNDYGAGVILARRDAPNERYILTNYHVVKGGPVVGNRDAGDSRLYVRFSNGKGYYASIKAADPRSDLAVLDIDQRQAGITFDDLTPLKFAENERLVKGRIVIALGNPLAIARDGSPSAAWGIVANVSRRPIPPESPDETSPAVNAQTSLHHTGTLLQVDLKLNLGTSGGALVNLKGEFVGLTTSLAAIEGYETSAGYAVPADERFRRIFEALARGEEVEYGFLGVSPSNLNPQELSRSSAIIGQSSAPRLLQVYQNSPASRGGIRSGDLVLSIEGHPILNSLDLMREISLLPPDHVANIRIWRPDESRPVTTKVRLGKWPAINDEEIIATQPRFPAWRGIDVDYPTGRLRFMQNTYEYPNAVLIRKIADGSPAAEAGLQDGEFIESVNGQGVTTPAEFHAAVSRLTGPVRLRMSDGRELSLPAATSSSSPPTP